MAPETLNKVKLDLRISHGKLDEAIKSDIEACLADLKVHGITHADDSDPLILNAVKLWCRSIYKDDAAKSAEYLNRYNSMRDYLKAARGYGWKGESDE